MADIFISYQRNDQAHAKRLATALEGQGWTVWWDPNLRSGERFDDIIGTELKTALCIVVIWSRRSIVSNYVKDEATYALNRDKLVPLVIEEVELPFRFEGIHATTLFNWDGATSDIAFRSLVNDIKSKLAQPAPAVEQGTAVVVEAVDHFIDKGSVAEDCSHFTGNKPEKDSTGSPLLEKVHCDDLPGERYNLSHNRPLLFVAVSILALLVVGGWWLWAQKINPTEQKLENSSIGEQGGRCGLPNPPVDCLFQN